MNNKTRSMDLFLLDLAEAMGHTSKRDESYGAPFAMTADEALERAAELLEERDEYRSLYKNALAKLAAAQADCDEYQRMYKHTVNAARAVMAGGK